MALRFSNCPDPTRPATRTFCHYPTRSRPEVKNHYPSVSAVITFVLLRWQWLIMAFDNMCVQIILSVKSLCTYLACEHSIFVHMDFTVPCKVSFFEHISTFVTFLFLMPLSVVLVQFGFGHKSFFTLCTGVLKHHLDLAKSRAELALHICQKVRVIHRNW